MKDKSNISLAVSVLAILISLYSLNSKNDDTLFVKSENKTYVSADPAAKNKLDDLQKKNERKPFNS